VSRQRKQANCMGTTSAGFCGGRTKWAVDSEGRYVSKCERCGTQTRAGTRDHFDLVAELAEIVGDE
jgi:hypothetical protein